MKSKKKILVFIDLPIILRHFIANNTFRYLEKEYDLVYVFNQEKYNFLSDSIVKKNISSKKIRTTKISRKRAGRWFLLYIITVLRQQKNSPNYKARLIFEENRLGKRNVFLARIAGIPILYDFIRFIFIKLLGIDNDIKSIFEKENPSLIIHPSILQGYYVNDLLGMYERSKKSIPLIFLMNSWDNPSSKAFCTGSPTKLVVWGNQTKNHAVKYMKMSPEDIECFGAAQFEIYKKKCRYTKKELAEFFKVDPNKKIILYAGAGSGKHETEYLIELDNFISKNYLNNCHIIYRPHPWRGLLGEGEKDFFSIKWENISIDPTMSDYYKKQIRNPSQHPSLFDYEISYKLLNLVDAVISPLSTMLIESLLNGKPILLFFPKKRNDGAQSTEVSHYSELIKLKNVNVCFEEKEFLSSCLKLFSQINSKTFGRSLKKDSEFFVKSSKISYGENLYKLVKKYI